MAACAESGDYEKAFACYDLAAGSDPGNVTAYIRAGLLHPERGEVAEAKECAEQALAADTTSPDAWAIRCGIDAAAGDVVAFEPDAFCAEVCGADLSGYAAGIGDMYAKAGQAEKAEEYYLPAFELAAGGL